MAKVLIQVEGGLVQAVFVDNQEVEVIIQDFDCEDEDENTHQLTTGEYFTGYIDRGILNPELVENIYNTIMSEE